MRQRPPPVTADDVRAVTFTRTRFREGYDTDQVDAFLQRVHEVLATEEAGRSSQGILTPDEVLRQRFAATKYRPGYDQNEVDDLLDRVVIALRSDVDEASSSVAPDLHPAPRGVGAPYLVALVLVGFALVVFALVR